MTAALLDTETRLTISLQIITTDPNPDVKKQIVRELSFNKSCASTHICQYYGAYMDDTQGSIGISMEFCEGGSLDSIYREVKKLGGRTGEKVLGKVAEGVLNGGDHVTEGRRMGSVLQRVEKSLLLARRQVEFAW